MKLKIVSTFVLGAALLPLQLSAASDVEKRLLIAAQAFKEVMGIPDKAIPQDLRLAVANPVKMIGRARRLSRVGRRAATKACAKASLERPVVLIHVPMLQYPATCVTLQSFQPFPRILRVHLDPLIGSEVFASGLSFF